MANFVVWLDAQNAKIFELHGSNTEEHKMKRHEIQHHNLNPRDQETHAENDKFYHQLSGHLTNAHEILLIGPGQSKTLFKKHLDTHHHADIAKKVVGVETVDHPTDGQIVALGKKFFKAHLAFE